MSPGTRTENKRIALNSKRLTAALALLLAASASAHATVWWPEVASVVDDLTVYKDYDDATLFYYVPKGVTIASNDAGTKMINHELFFNRLQPARSATQYNLTFEPILSGPSVSRAQAALSARYGAQARLVPLPVTTMNFEVTHKYDRNGEQYSAPFSVHVPGWTGDLHAFHQRFSVVMIGNMYQSEPAMSRFMTNPAGNAFVGTLHYGFRGVQVPFQGYAKVNIHQFRSRIKAHLSASYGFWASADIATAIEKIKDDQSVFIDVKKDEGYESEVWKSLVAKMIEQLFQPVPNPPTAPSGGGSGFSFFKLSASHESITVDRVLTISLREAVVKDRKGDIDITGGGVQPAQLSRNIKYLCDMWAKFDTQLDRCVDKCEPAVEYYNPATKTCHPAFGQPENGQGA